MMTSHCGGMRLFRNVIKTSFVTRRPWSHRTFSVVDHSSMHDTSTVTDYVEPDSKFLASDRKNRNV